MPETQNPYQFDGHGRLSAQHRPEQQNADGSPAYTTYSYNADDSTSSVTDARGASTNLVYGDSRGLVTNVNYSVPAGSGISVTPSVTLTYDNVGNRTSMSDGLGTVAYQFNQLSQMTAETRQFIGNLTYAPANGYRMEYSYSLSGQLKSYKDPYNRQFDFTFDKSGRNLAVNGTAYAGVTNYMSDQQYRAFGALKQVSYGNQTTATMTYNNRLQPSSYRLNDSAQTLFGKDYVYTTGTNNDNDGLLKKSGHFEGTMTEIERLKRNQVNTYDAVGRIKTSETGETSTSSNTSTTPFGANIKNGPFQQNYSYNAFGNLTQKNDRDFADYVGCTGCPRNTSYSETIVNNRTQSSSYSAQNINPPIPAITNYQYDQDGRLVNRDGDLVNFDAAGKMVAHDTPSTTTADDSYSFDGDGNLAKWIRTDGQPSYFYLRSTVLGADVLELGGHGSFEKEYVFSATRARIAFLKTNEVTWLHAEPSGKESYEIKQDRTANSKLTYDPTGAPATTNGYNGGGICPPQSCYSTPNTPVAAMINMGFNGLEILMKRKREMWLSTHLLDEMSTPLGWEVWTKDNPVRQIKWGARSADWWDGYKLPIYGFYTNGKAESLVFAPAKDVKADRLLDLKAFLNASPGCKKFYEDNGLSTTAQNAEYIDPLGDEEMMNKTLDQLGFGFGSQGGGDTKLKDKFTDGAENHVRATADIKNNRIYYNGSEGNMGITTFHEILHLKFGYHVDIAKNIGLPYTMNTVPDAEDRKVREAKALGLIYVPKTIQEENNKVADDSIAAFIKNDCSKEKTK